MDYLIENAPDVGLWHAPLVGRPKLSGGAATRLAQFLADNLLEVLQMRADLDADTLDAVKAVVHQRIGDDGGPLRPMAAARIFSVWTRPSIWSTGFTRPASWTITSSARR